MAKIHYSIVIDNSGSMQPHANESNKLFGEFIDRLVADKAHEYHLRICRFPYERDANVVDYDGRERKGRVYGVDLASGPPEQFAYPNWEAIKHGGGTPLYRAIGQTLTGQADACGMFDKSIFILITDGEADVSGEYTLETTTRLIKDKVDNGWEFGFIAYSGSEKTRETFKNMIPDMKVYNIKVVENPTDYRYRQIGQGSSAYQNIYEDFVKGV